MNNVIPLTRKSNRVAKDCGEPVKNITIELPADLVDSIKTAAGYACKSPAQWVRDALSAILQMDQAG
jgi:hypothetical protein